jgi:hypothetical protein
VASHYNRLPFNPYDHRRVRMAAKKKAGKKKAGKKKGGKKKGGRRKKA